MGLWASIDELSPFTFSVIATRTISGLLSTKEGTSVTVDWGDGTSNTYSGTDQASSKDYGSVGNRTVVFTSGSDKLTKFTMTRIGANISFDLSQLPRSLTYFNCVGSNTITGNLSSLPVGLTYFSCSGSNTIGDYSGKAWANNQIRIYFVPVAGGGLSSAEIDQLLIDLAAAGGTWSADKQVYLRGTNAARTAASDAAVATLVSKGVTVTTT